MDRIKIAAAGFALAVTALIIPAAVYGQSAPITVEGELERPVANRLFFAGEAFGREFAQTCGGASLSGQRTAKEVLKALD